MIRIIAHQIQLYRTRMTRIILIFADLRQAHEILAYLRYPRIAGKT